MAEFSKGAWIYWGTLVLALTCLCLLPRISGARPTIAGAVAQTGEPRPRKEYPPNRFDSDRNGNLLTLRYSFQNQDKDGDERIVTCQMDEWKSVELRKSLGIDLCPEGGPSDFPNQPLSACLKGSDVKWQGQPSAAPASGQEAHPYARYMLERGLRCHEGHVVLDYPSLIVKAAPVFENCARSLNDQLNGEPNLRLLMEFFLAMKRADIPQVDEKLHEWTGGYLLPTEVLGQNMGDCDSKASAFAAVKRKSYRLVIFRSSHLKEDSEDGHAFVGVENPGASSDLPLRDEGVWTEDNIEAE